MNEIQITQSAVIAVKYNNSEYVVGKGSVDVWQSVVYKLGDTQCSTFPCEWTNAYGNDVFLAESNNIKELATVRVGYNPDLLKALNATEVEIYRNSDIDQKEAFTVIGSADNIKLQNRLIEFKVRRLVVKPNGNE